MRAGSRICLCVVLPSVAIEICRDKNARVVLADGIGSDGVRAAQVCLDGDFIQRRKFLMRTVGALDLWLSTHAGPPFVVTRGSISFLSGLWVLPKLGIDGSPRAKQVQEEGNLLRRQ